MFVCAEPASSFSGGKTGAFKLSATEACTQTMKPPICGPSTDEAAPENEAEAEKEDEGGCWDVLGQQQHPDVSHRTRCQQTSNITH